MSRQEVNAATLTRIRLLYSLKPSSIREGGFFHGCQKQTKAPQFDLKPKAAALFLFC
jgi:hypothetical protein